MPDSPLAAGTAGTPTPGPPPPPQVEFRPSPIHGLGGFAGANFRSGALILEYLGERITKAESLRRCEQDNRFIFEIDADWDLDGSVDTNPARWLNHSCRPNCDAEFIDGQIWIVARRDIAAGEELTFNYGYDLTDYREHPCHCGAPDCAGFIVAEELFDDVRRHVDMPGNRSLAGEP